MTDRASEGNFYWTDCGELSNFTQSRWATGQPSDVDGSDNCVQLSDNGNFNDRDCESSFPFVCEINESSKKLSLKANKTTPLEKKVAFVFEART